MIKHKHHIIPKYMGGSNEESNIVEVTIETHANLHKQLWEEFGNWQDYIAWQGLLRNIDEAEIIKLKQSLGGREGGLKTKGVSKTEEHRKNISESLKGKPSNFLGKTHSEETVLKLKKPKTESTVLKMKKPKTKEHRKNISESMRGIKRTPEQKEKYRLAALKRWSKNKPSKEKEKEKVELNE